MVGKTKRPTAEEKCRMTILKEHVPCVPCLMTVRRTRMPSIQHTVSGMKRDGHMMTYSSCDWHHFGMVQDGMTKQQMSGMLGPSLTFGRRTFEEFFGHELLLVRLASFLVEEFQKSQWIDYNVPHDIRRRAIRYWESKRS